MGRLDVLSFWPSFSLLVFFLVIFLECRVIGGRVTLPLGSFLMVFCYGAIGAPLFALLLQQILLVPDATPIERASRGCSDADRELAKHCCPCSPSSPRTRRLSIAVSRLLFAAARF